MSGAFSDAVDALFADEFIASDVTYTPAATLEPQVVRAMVRAPDVVRDFGDARIHTDTMRIDVRTSEVPNPRPGDRIALESELREVQGEPERDTLRLIWRLDTRAVA